LGCSAKNQFPMEARHPFPVRQLHGQPHASPFQN
jgi:hypothetical protein